jgi:hypothetical protein
MQPQNARLLPSLSRPAHPVRRRACRVHLPRDTVLTPTVLVGAARKLPTPELERIIDALIAETDLRAGDADREPDSDDEPDDAA